MVYPPSVPEDVTGLPSRVATLHSFLNTLDSRTYRAHGRQLVDHDRLDSYSNLEQWLLEHDLMARPGSAASTRSQQTTLALALDVRAALRSATCPWTVDSVVTEFRDVTLVPRVDADGLALAVAPPSSPHIVAEAHAAIGRLLVMAFELNVTGAWSRLKMCAAPDCQWIFYDRSRPGTGRWCSPSLCGNRYKQRRARTASRGRATG